ncbi:hypothetical protein B1M_31547 [Burkholderia sp. TJI49]|nr:hypothetical protein B1M_31547 [Burkholderia sp. TJI49]
MTPAFESASAVCGRFRCHRRDDRACWCSRRRHRRAGPRSTMTGRQRA